MLTVYQKWNKSSAPLKINANKYTGEMTFTSHLTRCLAIYEPVFLFWKKNGKSGGVRGRPSVPCISCEHFYKLQVNTCCKSALLFCWLISRKYVANPSAHRLCSIYYYCVLRWLQEAEYKYIHIKRCFLSDKIQKAIVSNLFFYFKTTWWILRACSCALRCSALTPSSWENLWDAVGWSARRSHTHTHFPVT